MNEAPVMLKRLALRVAALAEVDRGWLLEQLGVNERQRLEALVSEAMALGLHRDPSVLAALSDSTASDRNVDQDRALALLDQLPPYWRELADVLRRPVDGVVRAPALRRSLMDWAERRRTLASVGAGDNG